MPEASLAALGSTVLVSLVSLIGLAALPFNAQPFRSGLFVLVSLAAGAFFGDALFHLLPEAYEARGEPIGTGLAVLAGLFGFFVLEKFLRWHHAHGAEDEGLQPMGVMNVMADGVHNLIDGVAIGASYLAGMPTGVATTIAVVLHEIPQEIGDFGVLLHAGLTRGRALLFNFATGCTAIGGAVVILLVGTGDENLAIVPTMQALTAGMFLYIAGSDLVPDLHREPNPAKSFVQLIAMAVGASAMLALALVE